MGPARSLRGTGHAVREARALPGPGDPRRRGPAQLAGRRRATGGRARRAAHHGRRRRPRAAGTLARAGEPRDPRLRPEHGVATMSAIVPTIAPRTTWTSYMARRRRALYISSPIGLGHAQRDISIADELRKLRPDVEIDWLAQSPVTTVLQHRGERIHPMSAELASESAHWTSEAFDHDLNAFQALRRMDEILLTNFMVFLDVLEEGEYDLVIGDESWDVDHYLHE